MKKNVFFAALENAGISRKIGMAVVRQLGYSKAPTLSDDDELSHTLANIASHGINGGYGGFIYYTDTNAFFRKNRAGIVGMVENMADGIGEGGPVELVCGFSCLKGGDAQERRDLLAEVARALYGRPKKDDYLNVPNALAWFAGEEVARAWTDYLDEHKNG